MTAFLLVAAGCGETGGGPSAAVTAPAPGASGAEAGGVLAGQRIDFGVNGSIGGKAVSGKLADAAFTVACNAAGPNQILAVHWTGSAPGNVRLQGTIDLKPGTWTFGSAPGSPSGAGSAQGTATIGLSGGKATDNLIATSGSATTSPSGGTISATFTGGSDALTLSGSWSCPPAASK